ncbi:hypothetical protein VHEMI00300 [[Torrubiella] hemipterigena]|uniref:Ketoisovalerate reductase n=1 Tax=[Torrubiella] hemipterigena TaxID=1531966 RepID=A0A0A1T1X0_9HYPO|nr:hypothetical protein VHEMI00300 [[Torrubiella] hemipterigena]
MKNTMPSPVHPRWLATLLADNRPPPRLFAWTPANLPSLRAASLAQGNHESHTNGDDFHTIPNSSEERIFIIGAGNIGRLYASYMAQHPNPLPITLVVHRKELLSQWVASEGIGVSNIGGSRVFRSKQFNIEWWTDTRPQFGPVREVADGKKLRNVFIATKATAGLPEADRLRRYLGRSSSVVFAQNGVCKLWPPHGPSYIAGRYQAGDAPTFSACVVNHGVASSGPFSSIHSVPADASIGPVLWAPDPTPPRVQQTRQHKRRPWDNFFIRYIASTPLLDTKRVSSGELWLLQLEKLVANSAINPLSALLRCKTGILFASDDPHDPLAKVLDKMLWQTSSVIQRLINHDISRDIVASYTEQQYGAGIDGNLHEALAKVRIKLTQRFSPPVLKAKLYVFGRKLDAHRSSMLQDAEAGRKTEVRDFNGWIVDMAHFLDPDLDVSVHQGLIELIESGQALDKEELAKRLL